MGKFGQANLKSGAQSWNSKFGLPNLKIGQIPSLGTTYLLNLGDIVKKETFIWHKILFLFVQLNYVAYRFGIVCT